LSAVLWMEFGRRAYNSQNSAEAWDSNAVISRYAVYLLASAETYPR
jgi:hypothetical protein